MKTFHFVILGIAAVLAVIGSILVWRAAPNSKIGQATDRVHGTAKSVWGKVEDAASKLGHTEKDPQEN